jgi:hypothetical protein
MSPAWLLSIFIAAGLGLVYHLWRGGGFFRLLISIGAAWVGLAIGHLVGQWLGWQLVVVGELHLAEGLIGALLLLTLVNRAD